MRVFLFVLLAGLSPLGAQETPISVSTAADTPAERATREQLLRLLAEHDIERWLYTREVLIDETEIPHSHPVLTLHTRHRGNDLDLMATFIHEQYHWLVDDHKADEEAAIEAFREIFPDPPSSEEGGARDKYSSYLHLIVCDLEFQGMTALFGEDTARRVLAGTTHYEWIYERVLGDPRVREINERFGFVVR